MPLVRIISSLEIPAKAPEILRELSALLARELEKPESYVMTCWEPRAAMTFGGTDAPTCYVEVKNIGIFTPDRTERLSAALTKKLTEALKVPPDRIYIEFSDAKPHLWGYHGGTFA